MEADPTQQSWLTARLHSEFMAFLLVGGFAALVNVFARYAFNWWMNYHAAIFLAYLCGMVTAFLLSRLLVFSAAKKGDSRTQFLRFTLVNVAAVIQVWAISVGLANYLFPAIEFRWHPEDVAHCIGVAVPALTSYFGHKWFSFR